LEETIDRKIQSLKDRRLDKLPQLEEKVNQLIAAYEGAPKEPSPEVVGTTEGGEKAYMEAMSAQILEGAGIDFEDPEYLGLVKQYGGKLTPEQWINTTKEFVKKRATKGAKQEGVTEAAGATAAGTVVEVSDEAEMDNLANRLSEIRAGGKAAVDKNLAKERDEIRARMEELDPQEELGIVS
jgi:3-methyladenine DNA glycosylase/8-oxoguanine DNA glycosylase